MEKLRKQYSRGQPEEEDESVWQGGGRVEKRRQEVIQQQSLKVEVGGGGYVSVEVTRDWLPSTRPDMGRSTLVFCGWAGELA